MGMPGLVRGVNNWGSGMLVFSENLKHYTRICQSRVAGNKIKFNYGSEEIKEDRSNCWEFCVKRCRIQVITKAHRANGIQYPLELSRPEDKTCPICFDDLSGNVVKCVAGHQTCLKCFNLLPVIRHGQTIKKCVLCNTPNYNIDEYAKVEQMNGALVKEDPYFYMSLTGMSSFKDYLYNEALFLGMLKNQCNTHDQDNFRVMLMSSLYNFYMSHNDAFSTYNFNLTHYKENNNRSLNPSTDDMGDVINEYLNAIYEPEKYKLIVKDVAYTNMHLGHYDDIEFYRDLETMEGNINRIVEYPNDSKMILKREIYFRIKIHRSNRSELMQYYKNIFTRIINNATRYNNVFNNITIEE